MFGLPFDTQIAAGLIGAAATIWAAILAARWSKKQATNLPTFLRPIDTALMAHQLKLDEEAVERGRRNSPSVSATTLDAVEQQVVQTVQGEWAWQGGELINNLRAYAQRLIGYSVEAEASRLEVMAKDTLAQLREAHHRAEADLGPLREDFVAARNELAEFRKEHRLTRAARLPSHRWTTIGLLTILISAESVLNGFFFRNEDGLIGGIAIAVGISLTNVISCFLLGLWPMRWCNHRNYAVKLPGILLTVLGVAGIVALHAFAGHFRDAMATVGEQKALDYALNTITAKPWRLVDIKSYYLFGLGMLFSLWSCYKGATLDDPYPGYGAATRRSNDARDAYSDEHDELFESLAKIKDDTVSKLDDGILRIPNFPQQAANIRAQRAALVQSFRGYEAALETAMNQLLARYRDQNRRVRSELPPAYFDSLTRLPQSFLVSPDVQTLVADQGDTGMDVNARLAELRRLSQEVLNEYERLMLAYPHPTQMT